jgi:hypothetical protein
MGNVFNAVISGLSVVITASGDTKWSASVIGNFGLSKYNGSGSDNITMSADNEIRRLEGKILFSVNGNLCNEYDLDVINIDNPCYLTLNPYNISLDGNGSVKSIVINTNHQNGWTYTQPSTSSATAFKKVNDIDTLYVMSKTDDSFSNTLNVSLSAVTGCQTSETVYINQGKKDEAKRDCYLTVTTTQNSSANTLDSFQVIVSSRYGSSFYPYVISTSSDEYFDISDHKNGVIDVTVKEQYKTSVDVVTETLTITQDDGACSLTETVNLSYKYVEIDRSKFVLDNDSCVGTSGSVLFSSGTTTGQTDCSFTALTSGDGVTFNIISLDDEGAYANWVIMSYDTDRLFLTKSKNQLNVKVLDTSETLTFEDSLDIILQNTDNRKIVIDYAIQKVDVENDFDIEVTPNSDGKDCYSVAGSALTFTVNSTFNGVYTDWYVDVDSTYSYDYLQESGGNKTGLTLTMTAYPPYKGYVDFYQTDNPGVVAKEVDICQQPKEITGSATTYEVLDISMTPMQVEIDACGDGAESEEILLYGEVRTTTVVYYSDGTSKIEDSNLSYMPLPKAVQSGITIVEPNPYDVKDGTGTTAGIIIYDPTPHSSYTISDTGELYKIKDFEVYYTSSAGVKTNVVTGSITQAYPQILSGGEVGQPIYELSPSSAITSDSYEIPMSGGSVYLNIPYLEETITEGQIDTCGNPVGGYNTEITNNYDPYSIETTITPPTATTDTDSFPSLSDMSNLNLGKLPLVYTLSAVSDVEIEADVSATTVPVISTASGEQRTAVVIAKYSGDSESPANSGWTATSETITQTGSSDEKIAISADSACEDWLTLIVSEDNTITLNTTVNEGENDRECLVTVTQLDYNVNGSAKTTDIQVVQKAAVIEYIYSLTTSPSGLTFSGDGGNQMTNITSTREKFINGKSVGVENIPYMIQVEADQPATYTYYFAVNGISGGTTSKNVFASGQSYTDRVEAYKINDATGQKTQMPFDIIQGSQIITDLFVDADDNVTYNISRNNSNVEDYRNANMTFSITDDSGNTKSIVIEYTQSYYKSEFSVSSSTVDFSVNEFASGGNKSVSVVSKIYDVGNTADTSDVSFTTTVDSGSSFITYINGIITTVRNDSQTGRTGSIIFTQDSSVNSITITLNQSYFIPSLTVNGNTSNLTINKLASGGTDTLTITSILTDSSDSTKTETFGYDVTNDSGFLTYSNAVITTSDNGTTAARSGNITVTQNTPYSKSIIVTVSQSYRSYFVSLDNVSLTGYSKTGTTTTISYPNSESTTSGSVTDYGFDSGDNTVYYPSSWSAVANNTFIIVSPTSVTSHNGSLTTNLQISLTNNTGSTRTGSVTLTQANSNNTITIPVSQAEAYNLSISPTSNTVVAAGSSYTINVTSNDSWTVTETGGATVSPTTGTGDGSVDVTIPANPDFSEKTFTIKVSSNSVSTLTANCVTTQEANSSSISVSPTTNTMVADGGMYTLTITTNDSWTISSTTGVTVSPTTGTGDGSVEVTIPINSTFSEVSYITTATATNGGYASCTTTQSASARTLSVEPTSRSIDQTGGTFNLDVFSNDSWTASSTSDVTISTDSGTGNGQIPVTIIANETTSTKTHTITVTNTTVSTLTATCTVTQDGKEIKSVIWIDPAEGTTITIDSSGTTNYSVSASVTGYISSEIVAYISTGSTYNADTATGITLIAVPNTNYYTGTFSLSANTDTTEKSFNVIISGAP